jgi:hypothetical protein
VILVRVALLLPSDDEPASAFALSGPGKYAAVTEASAPLSAVRLNLPKNTLRWLALVGFLRFYPPGSGSGPSGSQAFTCLVRASSHLRSALFPLLSGLAFVALPREW